MARVNQSLRCVGVGEGAEQGEATASCGVRLTMLSPGNDHLGCRDGFQRVELYLASLPIDAQARTGLATNGARPDAGAHPSGGGRAQPSRRAARECVHLPSSAGRSASAETPGRDR